MSSSRLSIAGTVLGPTVVVVPGRFGESRPTTELFIRRRLIVSLLLSMSVMVLWMGAGNVLANRGGAPASTSAVRPATAPVTAYVVQPGDTLWSLAASFRGSPGQVDYVDALVAANGGTSLRVGQVLTLP